MPLVRKKAYYWNTRRNFFTPQISRETKRCYVKLAPNCFTLFQKNSKLLFLMRPVRNINWNPPPQENKWISSVNSWGHRCKPFVPLNPHRLFYFMQTKCKLGINKRINSILPTGHLCLSPPFIHFSTIWLCSSFLSRTTAKVNNPGWPQAMLIIFETVHQRGFPARWGFFFLIFAHSTELCYFIFAF